jgi:hypothetical protein
MPLAARRAPPGCSDGAYTGSLRGEGHVAGALAMLLDRLEASATDPARASENVIMIEIA